MSLFVIDGDKLTAVEDTSYLNEGVLERRHLQALLKHTLINAENSPFGDDLKLICEEFSNWEEGSRRIDLLCIDNDARVVVVNETHGRWRPHGTPSDSVCCNDIEHDA
jgi:hypothetical protein